MGTFTPHPHSSTRDRADREFDFQHDQRDLKPGVSVHFMVLHPPIDRLAALTTFLLPHVQEIVIVDTGSSDADIAKMESWNYPNTAPVRVIHREFKNFSHTRNQGLAEHQYEWTLGLDPDELPSYAMMEHMKKVTHPDYMRANKAIRGYLTLVLNWWDGTLGPRMPYHWHVRLWKTKRSWMYRPIHELVMVGGTAEGVLRGKPELPKAPEDAYLIHSKGGEDIEESDQFYRTIGGQSSL